MDFAEGLGRRAVPDRPCLLKEKIIHYWKETENRDLKKPGGNGRKTGKMRGEREGKTGGRKELKMEGRKNKTVKKPEEDPNGK